MKLYHLFGLGAISLLSLVSLSLVAPGNESTYQTDYQLETLNGDILAVAGIQLENIAHGDNHSYSKVVINGTNIQTTPTTYDATYRATEEILENRELYRGLSPFVASIETDDYLIVADFDSSYYYNHQSMALDFRLKDKKSDKTIIKELELPAITYGDGIYNEKLTEHDGIYYYVACAYDMMGAKKDRLLVYEINPQSVTLSLKFEKELPEWETSEIHDGMIYQIPGESNQLIITSLKTGEEKSYTLTTDIEDLSIYAMTSIGDQLYFVLNSEYIVRADFNDELKEVSFVNLKTPSFINPDDPYNGIYFSEMVADDELLYILYDSYSNGEVIQYLAALNPSDNVMTYEGKIRLKSTQGLVDNYHLAIVSQ